MSTTSTQPEVFISYKIGEPRSEQLRDDLTSILQAEPYNLKVITDVTHLKMLDDLKAFMTRLGRARYVIVILTEQFLDSENCMYELATMANKGRLGDRLFPIVFQDAMINSSDSRIDHATYWSERHKKLADKVAMLPPAQVADSTKAELSKLEDIVRGCQDALSAIAGMRYLGLQKDEGFDPNKIAGYISTWTIEHANKKTVEKKPDTVATEKKEAEKKQQGPAQTIPTPPSRWRNISLYGGLPALALVLFIVFKNVNRAGSLPEKAPTSDSVPATENTLPAPIQALIANMVKVPGGTLEIHVPLPPKVLGRNTHTVTIADFSIGATEVTQAQWQAVMGQNPNHHIRCPNCPVENIKWEDIPPFIQKLNQMAQMQFRLPDEAEWEYAALGATQSREFVYAGSDNVEDAAWYEGNASNVTQDVKTKGRNALGLFDMSGNVAEWCRAINLDLGEWRKLEIGGKFNAYPVADTGVLRGGSVRSKAEDCAIKSRTESTYSAFSLHAGETQGLRLAMD